MGLMLLDLLLSNFQKFIDLFALSFHFVEARPVIICLCAVLWPLHIYQQKHPLNFIFLGLFTASLSLTVGVTCANTDGE